MTELAVITEPAPLDVQRWGDTLTFAARMAEVVNDTEFVPKTLRGRPEAVAATIVYGAELGLTPMASLQGIHIVEGRPAPSSELMRALIFRAGHQIAVHEFSGTRVRVSGLRRGRPESERVTVEWTADMAKAAGLAGKTNWRNYPRAMLLARATGDLARLLFADTIKGLGYAAEEGFTDDQAAAVWGPPDLDAEPKAPARKAIQRKPRTKPAPSLEEPPAAPEVPADPEPPPVKGSAGPPGPADHQGEDYLARVRAEAELAAQEILSRPPVETGPDDTPLFPDLEPEEAAQQPDVTPPGMGPPTIGVASLKAIQTRLTRELGTAGTPQERHALVGAILGREVDTTKTLTRDEGFRVLAAMDGFTDGTLAWEFDPEDDTRIVITDRREPPPDD